MNTLATSIADYLSTDDLGAVVDYVPDYTLKDLDSKKLLVVPVSVEWHNITRGGAKRIFAFEVGVLQRLGKEGEIPGCIDAFIAIGDKLRNSCIDKCRCVGVETLQLYDPLQYKQAKMFTGIMRVRFSEL